MADERDKGGRPPGDGKVAVTIRLPAGLLEEVDELAEEERRNRSAQVQKMLEERLEKDKAPAGRR